MDKKMEDVDKRVEWLHSERCSAASDKFGEPKKTTRIGDKYQAQIPSLMTANKRLKLIKSPVCHDNQSPFEFGLPIPVSWVHNQAKNKETTNESAMCISGISGSQTDNGLLPVSCSSGEESWSVIERDGFLLGLYIFGKDLWAVHKFLRNKGLQNVTSYYYGVFYRSSEHQQWSMYRKQRNRKLPGKKIFKGSRRQELLCRLLPNVTDECKTRLTQISSMFDKKEVSFENYVYSLRDIVGMDLLVEAVAVSKEKRDLTTKAKKRVRNNKTRTACSSLKTEEIVNILKDRIGLCNARLNELFWEAVWPRLLANGWHSEQPRNYALQNSKHSLVFLAPGVSKFSRRSLVKGSQYFDSLNEVLNKVALEPQLLEHEADQDMLAEPHAKQSSDDEQDVMKCMIVDTSFVKLVKVKELASLTFFEPDNMQVSSSVYEETKLGHITEESQNTDDEAKGDPSIVIDLNKPRVDPGSEDDESSLCRAKQLETISNQSELPTVCVNGQIRQSTRNRALTTKALEAIANGFLNSRKKRRGSEDETHRRVCAKAARMSRCVKNRVDGVLMVRRI